MGADLLLAFCRAPRLPDGEPAPEALAREELARRIDALSTEELGALAQWRYGDGLAPSEVCADCGGVIVPGTEAPDAWEHRDAGAPEGHIACPGEDFDQPTERQMRDVLHRAVDTLFTDNRVCFSVVLDGMAWVVSGGLSGGDSPTDEYDDLQSLAMSGVADTPIDPGEPA